MINDPEGGNISYLLSNSILENEQACCLMAFHNGSTTTTTTTTKKNMISLRLEMVTG